MPARFLSSEEYDEHAHDLYNDGDYDGALETLKEGLRRYPHSVELQVGLGFTRLAREEFVWAKHALEAALSLDPEHEEALVGMGEVLLRLGRRQEALELFGQARDAGCGEDHDLLLSMGRALIREGLLAEAKDVFAEASALHPESAEAAAGLGYTLHRLGSDSMARREIRRALKLDPQHHEARIFLGHLLYERGDWPGALKAFERVPPFEHWDSVAVWRVIELKRLLQDLAPGSSELVPWEGRLSDLAVDPDPLEQLLAQMEGDGEDHWGRGSSWPVTAPAHSVRTLAGDVFVGTWLDIVRQLRDAAGRYQETVPQYMRRLAEEQRARTGQSLPADDPEAFIRASAELGILKIEH